MTSEYKSVRIIEKIEDGQNKTVAVLERLDGITELKFENYPLAKPRKPTLLDLCRGY